MLDKFRFATATISDASYPGDVILKINGTGKEVTIHIAPEGVPGEKNCDDYVARRTATATTFIGAATDKVAFESLKRPDEKSSVNLWINERGIVKYASINYR